jgi:release factor glutamine methyltransferase
MRMPSNKIADVIRFFRDELKTSYESGEIETFIAYCFEEFLNMKREAVFLNPTSTISESELLKFNFAIKELKQHKPIQYILGSADFYGLKFNVNKDVLIPRPETEELVHLIIMENGKWKMENGGGSYFLLDIGTGSGCIPIALKKNIPSANVYALDISAKALDIAKQNAEMNQVTIEFFEYDILSSKSLLPHPDLKFDCIVSNPPYICMAEKEQMQKNVLDYEPHLALFVDDENPLLFYNAIADFALKQLNPKGKLYFEINQALGLETLQLLEHKGFKKIILIKDLNNNNRIVKCTI